MWRWINRTVLVVLVAAVGLTLYLLVPERIAPAPHITWGTTFTKSYAEYLGLDWRQVYLAILDDLHVKAIRIGINWDEIERERGAFHFEDYDWMLSEAAARDVTVLPAIGFKLPRWPECRAPGWAHELLPAKGPSKWQRMIGRITGYDEFENAKLSMLKEVVAHFKHFSNIKAWQVENEAFIKWFGDCPYVSESSIRREVEFVRTLDPRPILMTESGELSSGLASAIAADVEGVSLYRDVWNRFFGYITYPLPPSFYAHKATLLRPWVSHLIISELQLEAWTPKGILNVPLETQLTLVTPEKMKEHLEYAKRTGISEIYTWGVEWWWYLRIKGYPQLWETAREAFAK